MDNNYPFIKISPLPIKLCFYNMAFNLGITRLSKFRKMIAALEVGDYVTAGKEAQDSQWYNQVGARAERIVKTISECSEKHFSWSDCIRIYIICTRDLKNKHNVNKICGYITICCGWYP